jgi:hypothetical protein
VERGELVGLNTTKGFNVCHCLRKSNSLKIIVRIQEIIVRIKGMIVVEKILHRDRRRYGGKPDGQWAITLKEQE